MKVTDLRRSLMASLVAGGFLAPGVLSAAELDTNLVLNPGFENVEVGTTSYYNAPLILDWSSAGYAYSHDLSGEAVPDFANGGPLAGGGHWYFTPGNSRIESYDFALTQEIDVSAGPTSEAIAAGDASFDLTAFFSTFSDQADRGFVQADFLDAGTANLGSAQVSSPVSPALTAWTQFATSGTVPIGTQTVKISSWGEVFAGSEGSADGYTDNIDFRISGPGAIGDYNDDGTVDAADYTVWRDNLGTDFDMPNDSTPGSVDEADYGVWKSNFAGAGSGLSAGESVPEPTGWSIFLVGLAGLSSLRRR